METGVVPPHPPLGAALRAFETPADGTRFLVPESERDLPLTVELKKNLSLRGHVDPDLLYPFLFSSNTLSLGYLFSSIQPTKYTGIGIRYSAGGLTEAENAAGVAAYHYVLDEISFTTFLNNTLSLAAEGLGRVEDPRARLRHLTGNVLVLVLTLRRMTQTAAAHDNMEDFPLLTLRRGVAQLLFALWEEVWAVGYQLSDSDAVAYSSAALVRAAAAFHYYTEANKTDLLKGTLGPSIENAKKRVGAVLIGWITSRADASRQRSGAGSDIPWAKDGDAGTMIPGKYRALVYSELGIVVKKGKGPAPPAPRYAAAFGKAVDQCKASLLTTTAGSFVAHSQLIDPYARCLQIGADWAAAERKQTPLSASAAHPQALSAQALWSWHSETRPCPEGLEQLFEEGKRRYATVTAAP